MDGLGNLATKNSLSASEVGAVATNDLTNPNSDAYKRVVNISNGVIEAKGLKANELAVYADAAKTEPILLANVDNYTNQVMIGG